MAVFKKSLFIVFAFVLALASFIFIPQNKMQTTYATSELTYDNTYTYDGQVDSAVNGLGDYAIDDIEYLELGGTFLVHLTFDTSKIDSEFIFLNYYSNGGGNATWYYYSFLLNCPSYLCDLNFCIISRNSSSASIKFVRSSSNVNVSLVPNTGIYDFYFSQNTFNFTAWNVFTLGEPLTYDGYKNISSTRYNISPLFSSAVDMNSSTTLSGYVNFSIANSVDGFPDEDSSKIAGGTINESNHAYSFRNVLYRNLDLLYDGSAPSKQLYNFGKSLFTSNYLPTTTVSIPENSRTGYKSLTTYEGVNFAYIKSFNFSSNSGAVEVGSPTLSAFSFVEETVNLSTFYFYIKKPIHRINNTLVIYNYDYIDFLDNVNSISYSLSKGNDLYVVDYQGNVPNTKYIYVYNNEIQNITFDEYIYLYMTFNNSTFVLDNGRFFLDLGFDFNFTYYTEPLVLNDGSYNYEFKKPAYKDSRIGFSIAPPQLHIPIEAWVYNAVIFLCFYCPIISDILGLLKVNYFINSLMTVFTMFVGSSIGQFVNACLCFLLFWGIMKSLLPSMGGAFVGGVKNTYGAVKGTISTLYKDATAGKRIVKRQEFYKKLEAKRQLQVLNYKNKIGVKKVNKMHKQFVRNEKLRRKGKR